MLNCTSETRRWAGHVTALQTSTHGNAKTSSRSCTRPKSTLSDHPNISQRGKNATVQVPQKNNKRDWQMHAPENDMNKETHAEQKIQLTNQQIKILLSLLDHCSQAWTAHVIALQMSADGNAMTSRRSKSLASLKPLVLAMNYVQITCCTVSHAEILASSDQRTLLCTDDLCVIQFGRVTVTQCGTN